MGFKKFIRYLLGESVKEIELNRILDKVSKKQNLQDKEKKFLDLYSTTTEEDMKDYMYLSKNDAYSKVKDIIESGKIIICDIYDKNGKIGLKITGIENDFTDESCVVTMKGGETHKLEDRFLYNIIYSSSKDEYSLQTQEEFFEKIPVKNDNS